MLARRSGLNLRTLSTASFVLFGALVLAHTLGLAWTSSVVWRAAQAVEHDISAIDATLELDRTLREYHRLGLADAARLEPELQVTRSELMSASNDALTQLRAHVGDADERRLHDLLEAQLSAYRRERGSARALDARFDRVLAASAALREQHAANRRGRQAEAAAALQAQRWVSIGSAALVALGFVGIALGIRRFVVQPIFELERAMYRFRAGSPREPVSGGLLAETRALAASFDEMTNAIDRQMQVARGLLPRSRMTERTAVIERIRSSLHHRRGRDRSPARAPGRRRVHRLCGAGGSRRRVSRTGESSPPLRIFPKCSP